MSSKIKGVWTANPELPFFNGHFPNRPILPAVETITLAVNFIRDQLGRPDLRVQTVKMAKFNSPISPGTVVLTEAETVEPNEWQMELMDQSSGQSLASLRLVFRS